VSTIDYEQLHLFGQRAFQLGHHGLGARGRCLAFGGPDLLAVVADEQLGKKDGQKIPARCEVISKSPTFDAG